LKILFLRGNGEEGEVSRKNCKKKQTKQKFRGRGEIEQSKRICEFLERKKIGGGSEFGKANDH
jgi:hypothetical protein